MSAGDERQSDATRGDAASSSAPSMRSIGIWCLPAAPPVKPPSPPPLTLRAISSG